MTVHELIEQKLAARKQQRAQKKQHEKTKLSELQKKIAEVAHALQCDNFSIVSSTVARGEPVVTAELKYEHSGATVTVECKAVHVHRKDLEQDEFYVLVEGLVVKVDLLSKETINYLIGKIADELVAKIEQKKSW
jgi:hypothetical protein